MTASLPRGTGGRSVAAMGPVSSAWAVRAAPADRTAAAATWAQRAGLVSCWPLGRIVLERRFVKAGDEHVISEYVIAAAELFGGAEAEERVERELDRIVAPLGAQQLLERIDGRTREDQCFAEGIRDVAELAELSDLAPEGAWALAPYLSELVDILASLDGAACLSLLIATPPAEPGVAERLWAPPSGEGAVATKAEAVFAQRRPIRFRLRLAAGEFLPASALALAGALVLGPTESAGTGWRRATGARELDAARAALSTLSSDPWWSEDPGEERCSSTVAAGILMSLPVEGRALNRLPVAMRPVPELLASGAPIGRAAERSGRLGTQRLPWSARRGHTYVAGATNTGKSTLLGHILKADLGEAGRSTVCIDPHGPLSDEALALVPPERRDKVVVLDPLDPQSPAFDLIPPARVEDPRRTAARITDAMQELHDPGGRNQFIGPRFLQIVQMAVTALLDAQETSGWGPVTLAEVERMIARSALRREVTPKISDRAVREFWEQYERQSETPYHQSEVLMWLTSKFSPLTQGTLRLALSEPASYRFEDLLGDGGIVICRIPVGELGFRASNFLGRLMLSRLLDALAARSRGDGPPPEVSVVVDEAQTLADGETIERFLSQSRKWGASVTLASQRPSGLGLDVMRSVTTNCANLLLYRLAGAESELFADRLGAHASSVARLPNHYALAMTAGTADPYVIEGLPPLGSSQRAAQMALEKSRERYGRGSGRRGGALQVERASQQPDQRPHSSPASRRRNRRRHSSRPAEVQRLLDELGGWSDPTPPARLGYLRICFERDVWALRDRGRVVVGAAEGLVRAITGGRDVEDFHAAEGVLLERDEVLGMLKTKAGPRLVKTPVAGRVVEVNAALARDPSLLARDPYNAGWIAVLDPTNWRRDSSILPRGSGAMRDYTADLAARRRGESQ